MANIIGIAGSLRAGSLNAKLLRAAVELAPPSLSIGSSGRAHGRDSGRCGYELRMRPWFGGRLGVSQATKVFDEAGRLIDDRIRGELTRFMTGFAAFIAR
jgi:hypothetical protein